MFRDLNPIFGKNSSDHQTLSLRFVWSRVCAFLYSLGPRSFILLLSTMWRLIAMHARLFIWGGGNVALHGLITHCTLINFRKCGLHFFLFGSLFIILCRPYIFCKPTRFFPWLYKISYHSDTNMDWPALSKCLGMVLGLAYYYPQGCHPCKHGL